MKILNLTLKKKWFDQIANFDKVVEYRDIKEYWRKRLEGRQYDYIFFRNGYGDDKPLIIAKYGGFCKVSCVNDLGVIGRDVYAISIGSLVLVDRSPVNSRDEFVEWLGGLSLEAIDICVDILELENELLLVRLNDNALGNIEHEMTLIDNLEACHRELRELSS